MAGLPDRRRRAAPRWALLGAWTIALSWLTLTPRPPHVPLGAFDHADKVGHFVAWMVLAALAARALRARWDRAGAVRVARVAWIAAVGYGTAIELLQLAVPGRSAEWLDWVADALGAMAGAYGMARWEDRNGW